MTENLNQLNFRDLGGLVAQDGAIRPGVLFRSEGPRNLNPVHHAELRQLDIRNIFDLRSSGEHEAAPHDWHLPTCALFEMQVDADLRVFGHEGRNLLLQGPEPEIAINTMITTYREIPHALLPHWPVILDNIISGQGAVLVNCTAGKDRTGVAIAFLLELAGVTQDMIVADYLRSLVFGENMRKEGTLEPGFMGSYGFMPSPGQVDALVGVRPEYLAAARSEVDKHWSGFDAYFATAGLTPDRLRAFRNRLVAN